MCLITAGRVITAQRQLAQQNEQLRTHNCVPAEDAYTDHLTGLANRRRLDEDLQRVAGLANRYDMDACLAMCDVDRFKSFNDRFGHPAGDHVLHRLGAILRASSRDAVLVGRLAREIEQLADAGTAPGDIAYEQLDRGVAEAIAALREYPGSLATRPAA